MAADHERALVVRAREDSCAFGELYDFYLPRIYGFIYRRVQDQAVAEDLTSMTFQRGLENVRRSEFRNDSFGGWLYRVASNVVVDHVRRDHHHLSLTDYTDYEEREEPGDLALDALAAALDRDQLQRAMRQLSNNHREVLVLRFYDDLGACVGNGHRPSLAHVRISHAQQDLPPIRPRHPPADAAERT
jgi:RNA polymerase sigma-70 factor (ECF subfamily)